VITGNAKGVDYIANQWAMKQPDIKIILFPAEWDKYGTYAGPRRNLEMVKFCDRAIAIWNGSSKGTGDMIKKAKKAGKLALLHMYR
jgi:sugar lactone lactonase YvrE